MLCKGVGGSLEVLEDRVVLKHTMVLGLTTGFLKGHKTIPYSAISAVQYKRAGILSGYIQFTLPGGVESRKGIWDAQFDENTISFANNEVFDKAREFIEARIGIRNPILAPVSQAPSSGNVVDTLERLLVLREKGALTAEEYEQQKADALRVPSSAAPLSAVGTNDDASDAPPSEDRIRMMAAMDRALLVQPVAQPSPIFGRRVATK